MPLPGASGGLLAKLRSDVTTLAISSICELQAKLAELAAAGRTFDRALFQTHGSPGAIYFNHEMLCAANAATVLGAGELHKLFPNRARIHFDGCNVGQGALGISILMCSGPDSSPLRW